MFDFPRMRSSENRRNNMSVNTKTDIVKDQPIAANFDTDSAQNAMPPTEQETVDKPMSMCAEDEQLVAKIRKSKIGKTFDFLWGNPPPWGKYSKRDGDVALCTYMAFWTGHDEKRIDRIYRFSQRCTSEWASAATSDGQTYGQAVIRDVLARQKDFHWSANSARKDVTPAPSMSDVLASRLCEEVTTDAA